ncbi:MAG: amidohydrolase family protein [Dactylosporangium sp.]|nr:amidohydrolase family protein [Dactylosporangium sp.]NNJ61277.1 amidohydrolase family protein [Dactylosporangium sp.]
MIIDAHHHLWDPSRRAYPWLVNPAMAPINRAYTLDDFRRAISDQVPGAPPHDDPPWIRIRLVPAPAAIRTILVQTVSDRTETVEFLATAAASDGLVAGVIGWVDLTAADVADQLAELRAAPGGDLLVGVRHQTQDEPDPQWLARPEVRRGLRAVGDAGLVFDLLVLEHQLAPAREVVEALPEVTFVLDHLAKPPIGTGAWQPWAERVTRLAAMPNVSAKLSGLVTEDRWDDWETEHLIPYTTLAFDAFGAERIMFGSDWPVCTLAASYPEALALAEHCSAQLSPAERREFFSGTARRVYGLG